MRARSFVIPTDWDRSGLPAWTYTSEEMFALERDLLFRRSWQLVGHVADLPEPGSYLCLDVVGERAIVVRGKDLVVRAFHNVCRHRGSRVVGDEQGRCKGAIVCPFHAWSYNFDGTLRGTARPQTLPKLDPVAFGLKPLELEIWHGFLFVRFQESDQPSVAEILRPFDAEVAGYRLDEIVPSGDQWSEEVAVNWKSVRDVDNEGYHVPMAHPGLQDLYGRNYFDEPFIDGASRSVGTFDRGRGSLWSVKHYKKILPQVDFLPETHQRAWVYIGLFPNTVLTFYPDSVMFYQEFPLAAGRTLQRGRTYARREESRELRLSRYLSKRIDRTTSAEDVQLTVWSYEAAQSSGYDGIILSDLEYGVRSHHDHLRRVLPVMTLDEPPAPGTLASVNEAMMDTAWPSPGDGLASRAIAAE